MAGQRVESEDEFLEIQQAHYILATSSRADDRTRVLKEGETFAVFDRFGDVQPVGLGEQGFYVKGTRFLSRLELRLGGRRPNLLSSNVREDNDVLTVDLSNPDLLTEGMLRIPRGELHVQRSKFLWDGSCYERVVISNYGGVTVFTDLALRFDADFADIFEVRGSRRARRGTRLPSRLESGSVELGYQGVDGLRRFTRLAFETQPSELEPGLARFALKLEPHASTTLHFRTEGWLDGEVAPERSFREAEQLVQHRIQRLRQGACQIKTSNGAVNRWLSRSRADLHMMITDTPYGPFPYAGVPWFSTPFGRDSIITALEYLWVDPSLAAGVLRFLARNQATGLDSEQEAEPGKIVHELRDGEMAGLGEVPFGRYYGSVDSTPLFVVLAGEYFERTGDAALIGEIWPNLLSALEWIDTFGDADADGFVEYERRTANGLTQQGWKDSADSVFHADGHIAKAPIALSEVQAYVYLAKRLMAGIASARGELSLSSKLLEQAAALKQAFSEAFWCEDLGTFALALDGDKRPCRVLTSNAGHVLMAGLASDEQAERVVSQLMSAKSFSGWGIRTLAEGQARYNPMSYHNGSVWPHDTALVGLGLSRYGFQREVLTLFSAMMRAGSYFDLNRMPELFCGFHSRAGQGPTLYPVACAPQAWAAAAPFLLLSACLGLSVNGREGIVSFVRPALPSSIAELRIEGLHVGPESRVNLLLERHEHDVGITVTGRQGKPRVFVER